MMKKTMLLTLLLGTFLLTGCGSRQEGVSKEEKQVRQKENTPVVHVQVKKIYDDQGNLIGMDSVYVWSYSNVKGDTVTIDPDSLMALFRPFTAGILPDSLAVPSMPFFLEDSLFMHDFFRDDYFFGRFGNDYVGLERMFHELDSLKERFLKAHFPELYLP